MTLYELRKMYQDVLFYELTFKELVAIDARFSVATAYYKLYSDGGVKEIGGHEIPSMKEIKDFYQDGGRFGIPVEKAQKYIFNGMSWEWEAYQTDGGEYFNHYMSTLDGVKEIELWWEILGDQHGFEERKVKAFYYAHHRGTVESMVKDVITGNEKYSDNFKMVYFLEAVDYWLEGRELLLLTCDKTNLQGETVSFKKLKKHFLRGGRFGIIEKEPKYELVNKDNYIPIEVRLTEKYKEKPEDDLPF